MITKQMLREVGVSEKTISSLDAYPSAFTEPPGLEMLSLVQPSPLKYIDSHTTYKGAGENRCV